jgi:hypothetical protein
MAFSSSPLTKEPRAFSLGPWKMEIHSFTAADDDTSGVVTAKNLKEVIAAMPSVHCSAISVSGAAATLTFADPGASGLSGYVILLGR